MFVYDYTPASLLEKYEAYKEQIKDKGYIKRDNVRAGQKAGQIIEHKVPKPMTVEGFCLYAGILHSTFVYWLTKLKQIQAEASEEECTFEEFVNKKYDSDDKNAINVYLIALHIKESIIEELVGGGVAGTYNPALTAMIAGLKNQEEERDENARKVGDINITINGDKIDLSD